MHLEKTIAPSMIAFSFEHIPRLFFDQVWYIKIVFKK